MRIEALLIIVLIVTGVSLGVASLFKPSEVPVSLDFCQTDEDCVPVECCHPTSCINEKYNPDCEGIFCTQVCQGPLDCGAGYCGCINNKCQVVPQK